MKSAEIRNIFLEFFREKGHKIVPSAPIVVKNDPTLMFTNAGMNQFKDYFLGNKQAKDKRIADTQKCLRVSGKHNDLEEVGIDTYHHTMFEMLGNWSFGDYFKKEAIEWAWELLTERYKLPKERIYVTIFEGDESENLERDTEAYSIWANLLPETRILNGNKKDNFWEMGDTGPCGPCSEIHVDLRPEEEIALKPGKELVNNDHPQVIEIWNNVFIQYNRKADGSLEPLPDKHVDTGMGFERLVRVLQGFSSNYDTDIFQPIIQKTAQDFKLEYGKNEKTDIAFRVIADHIRAITFTIADGQLPSNTGAGYVIRRILRRAVRYGYTFLGMEEPYLYKLVSVLAEQFNKVFPEVAKQEDFIKKVIQEEENSFLRTLASGTRLFEKYVTAMTDNTISAQFAFELYDTYGFPFDLTQLMAREKNLEVDTEGFIEELRKQKERSRADAAKEAGDWQIINEGGSTIFLGYDQLEAPAKILRYRAVQQKGATTYQLVLNQTPFYPEGGGQVGDTGVLQGETEEIPVINTYKENDLIIHITEKLPENFHQHFIAKVDGGKRSDTANNHSATHLLHAALRQVLGKHVAQKGSLVNSKGLRFDFSHFAKMTDEEIAQVEKIVNQKIRENIPLQEERSIAFDEAVNKGAMALFGEKYGDRVRMITFDPQYSIELCGGIHVPATGKLGFFKIISESAVAAGVRRIEAITGQEAENYINTQLQLIKDIKEMLKNPKDLTSAIESLRETNKKASAELERFKLSKVADHAKQLAKFIEEQHGADQTPVFSQILDTEYAENAEMGKNLIQDLKNRLGNKYIILLGSKTENKASIWLSIPEKFIKENGLHAGNIIKQIAKEIEGGGGGQDTFATASGKNPANLELAIDRGRQLIIDKFVAPLG